MSRLILNLRSRLILAAILLIVVPARSAEVYHETAVKAAFLYRFTGYVEWPSTNLPSDRFTIAVLGSKPIADELRKLISGRLIKDRPAQLRIVSSVREALDAQMLFLGSDYDGDLKNAVNTIAGHSILVVTDDQHGVDDGAALSFVTIDRRVRFDVSLLAAQQSHLKISSELLGVAATVRGARLELESSTR